MAWKYWQERLVNARMCSLCDGSLHLVTPDGFGDIMIPRNTTRRIIASIQMIRLTAHKEQAVTIWYSRS